MGESGQHGLRKIARETAVPLEFYKLIHKLTKYYFISAAQPSILSLEQQRNRGATLSLITGSYGQL